MKDVKAERRNMTTKETALFLLLHPFSTSTFSFFLRGEIAFLIVNVSCKEKQERSS